MKVVIVTTGQPSTNPRMMKEVDALIAEGYSVKVLYSFWAEWAHQTDKKLFDDYPAGTFCEIGGNPFNAKVKYYVSRVIYKIIKSLSSMVNDLNDYSLARTSYMLVNQAIKQKANIYIAHTLGALPAAVKAATHNKVACGFDAEDYHSGESATPSSQRTKDIQSKYFSRLRYLTVASPLIGEAYRKDFPFVDPILINNVFSKKYLLPDLKLYVSGDTLKIFWFSQTIDKGRGIEDIIYAMGKLHSQKIKFTLLGSCKEEMRHHILKVATENNLRLDQIIFLDPVDPAEIFKIAVDHHIGMATEPGFDENNRRALSNKIFTYLLSGLAVVASDTPAQSQFLKEYPSIGKIYKTGNADGLANIFLHFIENSNEMNMCRQNAIEVADKHLNWENESKKFVSVIKRILDN